MSLQTDYLWTVSVVRLEPFVLSLPEPLRCAYHNTRVESAEPFVLSLPDPLRCAYHNTRVESAEPFVLSLSKHSCRVHRSTL